uniref:Uncharacterized protein n=1 Tax=Octopus bimaculoides TaxID=37653 RepID=A0A0L8HHD1_OCTBM
MFCTSVVKYHYKLFSSAILSIEAYVLFLYQRHSRMSDLHQYIYKKTSQIDKI